MQVRGKKEFYEHADEKRLQLSEELESSEKLGCKDCFAMWFSAFMVIVPVCVGILIALALLVMWLFGAL